MRCMLFSLLGLMLLSGATLALPVSGAGDTTFISSGLQKGLMEKMVKKFGADQQDRVQRGVAQASVFWQKDDGTPEEFENFCLESFASDPALLKETFAHFEKNFESVRGHFNVITRDLKAPLEVDIGEKLPVDDLFAKFSPDNHFQDDLFKLKIAFYILLNYPQASLDEKLRDGPKWSRAQWAQARLCDYFPARVPSEVRQKLSAADVESEAYVNDYQLMPGYFLTAEKKTLFKENLRLISHWGLRDHLKLLYNQPDGVTGMDMIFKAMERIIDQSIPHQVVNKPVWWDPFANKVFEKKGDQYNEIQAESEKDERYACMLRNFHAQQLADPYYKNYPRYIDRKFKLERQMPETVVEKLLIDILSSDAAPAVGNLIAKRLGRPLKPYDIWCPGFKSGGGISEKEMNAKVQAKYPNLAAFEKDVPNILGFLGFTPETARFIHERIAVVPARGAGQAQSSLMHSDKSFLFTRVPKGGMDYQGFNTAMHELGHNCEQTFTLHKADSYLMSDVPNSACTECFAFVFQNRDLDVLGLKDKDPNNEYLETLHIFWESYEIAGVSLVDIAVWRWMYENPNATPAQLKEKTLAIAKEVWNKYYAPVFKIKDCTLLAMYSHMIAYPLYLADYPLGHMICHQIESFLKGKNLGTEMERMCRQGNLTPKQWMEGAVGSDISAETLIKDAREAADKVK